MSDSKSKIKALEASIKALKKVKVASIPQQENRVTNQSAGFEWQPFKKPDPVQPVQASGQDFKRNRRLSGGGMSLEAAMAASSVYRQREALVEAYRTGSPTRQETAGRKSASDWKPKF